MFVLRSFVPLFIMTFFICLFIVLMQFLWRYIDDLVGKGLSIDVIAELFFYAALTMIPMALPLAVLLASLMTFGNLGEQFELTAMKAGGISLLKVMRPLIILMVAVAIGAFFFQNYMLPIAQTKMWTLLFSMRQKSPEVEIPEGVFYDQIPGYNLFVERKNPETGTLYNLMIYDVSRGFDNSTIILADSGRMAMAEDKRHLFLKLWQGEQFENMREQNMSMHNVPYRRESFTLKEILLTFDANFNRMDEGGIRSQYVGKNMAELQASIDSMGNNVDSVGKIYAKQTLEHPYMGINYYKTVSDSINPSGLKQVPAPDVKIGKPLNVDSIFRGSNSTVALNILTQAAMKAKQQRSEFEFKGLTIQEERKVIRRHQIELQKKFTLSVACLVFFFIGAPLGAIIRKGGLGMPLVISVILFIFYYIIDNTGYKMARDGKIPVWEGMWISTAILMPLGIFFTYKAMRDSAVFNKDAYLNFLRRLIGTSQVRNVEIKEISIDDVIPEEAGFKLDALCDDVQGYLDSYPKRQNYFDYWLKGYSRTRLREITETLEETVDYISNSRDKLVIHKLCEYPILRSLWLYHPTGLRWVGWTAITLFPLGFIIYLIGLRQQKDLRDDLKRVIRVSNDLRKMIIGEEESTSTEISTEHTILTTPTE